MDELERWLAPLGLMQVAPTLRANDVDLDILPELNEADLERLGLSLGQRKKLLMAVASLPHPSSPTAPNAAPAPSLIPASSAERRQLTVMFCDLVGSTALASRLDPEDLREVIGVYHRCVAATVACFDGFVAKYMGDGVLLYFGYPQAHEDDAERAVRVGLALVDAIGRLQASERLRVRVGIATGLVVVGDVIGTGAAQEQAVVGETPNLAARLQTVADPDAVVIAQSTRHLVQGLFDLADLGHHDLKGFAEPVQAWRVLGQSRRQDRFEARHAKGVTPLVGREQELGLLLDRWQQAKEGGGQVVLLSGEPGIGKSRLVRALRERLADEPYTPLSLFCSPFHQTSALYPIIDRHRHINGM
jgi:class 3 adenylate cyclase